MRTTIVRFGLLVMFAAGLLAAAAPVALAQEGGGEEEDFYRASDPVDPVTGIDPELKWWGDEFLRLGGGMLTQLNDERGYDFHVNAAYITLDYMWNFLPVESQYSFEVGGFLGGMSHKFDTTNTTPAEFLHKTERYALGPDKSDIEQGKTLQTANFSGDVLHVFLGAKVATDFFNNSKWDLSVSLGLGVGQAEAFAKFDNALGQRIDGTKAVVTVVGELGFQAGYSTDNYSFGVQADIFTVESTGGAGDLLLMRTAIRGGAYIGIRF